MWLWGPLGWGGGRLAGGALRPSPAALWGPGGWLGGVLATTSLNPSTVGVAAYVSAFGLLYLTLRSLATSLALAMPLASFLSGLLAEIKYSVHLVALPKRPIN